MNGLYFRAVQHKIENVTTAIEKLGKMTKGLKVALKNAQMMTEVEDLVCLFVLLLWGLSTPSRLHF